jgi:hypothetical protein
MRNQSFASLVLLAAPVVLYLALKSKKQTDSFEASDVTRCNLINSRGFLFHATVRASRVVSSDKRIYLNARRVMSLKRGDVVYVCTTCVAQLVPLLKHLSVPIVLVTGDADETVDDSNEYRTIANHPNILAWFAQNAALKHPKVV